MSRPFLEKTFVPLREEDPKACLLDHEPFRLVQLWPTPCVDELQVFEFRDWRSEIQKYMYRAISATAFLWASLVPVGGQKVG